MLYLLAGNLIDLRRAPGGAVTEPIELLLSAWRRTHDVALADRIDALTERDVASDRPWLFDRRDNRAHDAWLATLSRDHDALPALLRSLLIGSSRLLHARLDALATIPEDPRIARTLARMILAVSSSTRDVWASLVERAADPVANAAIRDVLPELASYDRSKSGLRSAFRFVRQRLPASVPMPALPPLPPRDEVEARLVDAIAEHPRDDGAVRVYADWLLEREHPRGEYLTLICRRERKGLTALLAKRLDHLANVAYLSGPLDDLATRWDRDRTFGIDRSLDVHWSATALSWHLAARHPLARAIGSMRFVGAERPQRFAAIAAFVSAAPRLSRLENVPASVAEPLAHVLDGGWRFENNALICDTRAARGAVLET